MRGLFVKTTALYLLLCGDLCFGEDTDPAFNVVASVKEVRALLRQKMPDGRTATVFAQPLSYKFLFEGRENPASVSKLSLMWIEIREESGQKSRLVWQLVVPAGVISVGRPIVANGPEGVWGIAFCHPPLYLVMCEFSCDGSLEPYLPLTLDQRAVPGDRAPSDPAELGIVIKPLLRIMSLREIASSMSREKFFVRDFSFSKERWRLRLEIEGRSVRLDCPPGGAWELEK